MSRFLSGTFYWETNERERRVFTAVSVLWLGILILLSIVSMPREVVVSDSVIAIKK